MVRLSTFRTPYEEGGGVGLVGQAFSGQPREALLLEFNICVSAGINIINDVNNRCALVSRAIPDATAIMVIYTAAHMHRVAAVGQ